MAEHRRTPLVRRTAALAVAAVLVTGGLAQGQQTQPAPADRVIQVYLGQSRLLTPPWPVARVAVTDPEVADVQVLTPQQVLVQGRTVGATDVLLWSEQEQVWRARLDVDIDTERLTEELNDLFEDSDLRVRRMRDVVVVSGSLSRAEQAAQLRAFMEGIGVRYVDMARVAGVQQVLLEVRVAEVSRRALRALGFNAFHVDDDWFGAIQIGSEAGPLAPVNIGVPAGTPAADNVPFEFLDDVGVPPSVTLFAGFDKADLELFLRALAENQYMRTLAEPTLVALSGQQATFLAGGEFPIPIAQGTGGGTAISVEYREFGVRLLFEPLVLGDGRIQLFVAPEVSELTDAGSVEVEGFRIPALVTRRASTTLQLHSGQSFAMAGLLQESDTARTSRIPALGRIPVLGALFRSVRYQNSETELMVLVTAHLVEPLSLGEQPPAPGMHHVPPSDWELYALGQIEGRRPPRLAPPDAEHLRRLGLHRLKGPGAWSRHDMPPARSRAPVRDSELPAEPVAPRPAPGAAPNE